MGIVVILVVACCMAVNGLRLRSRLRALRPLPMRDGDGDPSSFVLLTARDVRVPPDVRRSAEHYARENGVDMLDLLPRDLSVDGALDLIRHTDPRVYRADSFGMGRGACHSVLATETAVRLAGITRTADWEPDELGAATARLKLYSTKADIIVAPIHAKDHLAFRRARMRSLALVVPPSLALSQTLSAMGAGYLLIPMALFLNPLAGLLLAALYCSIPLLMFGGTPVRPRDLGRVCALRLWYVPASIVRTLSAPRTRWENDLVARRETARAWYRTQIELGVDRFLSRPATECPWCGSTALRRRVVTRDVLAGKPGRFPLDRCTRCGHVFQNPRLNPEGLAFYYRDVYDGHSDVTAERILSSTTDWYRARIAAVTRFTEPRYWLDVGTGKGHLCRVARTVLPGTRFDGLDFGAGVHEGARRGWLDHAYQGEFLELASELADRYDVISMIHYLEHTPDPLLELDTAAKVLSPGGHLLIEMPDPTSKFATILRGLWVPWLAPQHLHMIPPGNLRSALEERGLEVLTEERREADQGPDFVASAAALVNWLGLDVHRPWWPRVPARREYARVLATLALAGPVMALAILLDLVTLPLARRNSNAYRFLARKPASVALVALVAAR